MMIGKAACEELFPAPFQPHFGAPPEAAAPSAECLARWEDDGGRFPPAEAGPGSAVDRNVKLEHENGLGSVAAPILASEAYRVSWQASAADRWMAGDRMAGTRNAAHGARPSRRAGGSTGARGDIRMAPDGGGSVSSGRGAIGAPL